MTISTFSKRPVQVQAIQIKDTATYEEATQWMRNQNYPWLVGDALDPASLRERGQSLENPPPTKGVWINPANGNIMIRTLEGDMEVTIGDWIIQGLVGEFYPCKPDVFALTYDKVS